MVDFTGYRLIKLGERLLEAGDEALNEAGIKARHLNVLTAVTAYPDLSQQELSALIGIDVNSMVVVIDFLEEHGLATRERNPRDRRRHVVRVTKKGQRVVRRGSQLLAERQDRFFAALSPADLAELHRITGLLLGLDEP